MQKRSLLGFYRGKVVETDIPDFQDYGAVRIFLPDFMTSLDKNYDEENMGLIAYPANNPLGGRNPDDEGSYYQGSVYVPRKGAWVLCFFEGGSPEKLFYFAALDIKAAKLPPENRNVEEPHKVVTIIKTKDGRTIVVSDSPDVQRIEFTGKKRKLSGDDPAGNDESTYTIDGNQTTILFDEREGKEKILMRSHLGDFIHFDIDERELHMEFESNIHMKSNKSIFITAKDDVHIKANKKMFVESVDDQHIKTSKKQFIEADDDQHIKTSKEMFIEAIKDQHIKAGQKQNIQSHQLSMKSKDDMDIEAGGEFRAESLQDMHQFSGGTHNIQSMKGMNRSAGGDGNSDVFNGAMYDQSGKAKPASSSSGDDATEASEATEATEAKPIGERDT